MGITLCKQALLHTCGCEWLPRASFSILLRKLNLRNGIHWIALALWVYWSEGLRRGVWFTKLYNLNFWHSNPFDCIRPVLINRIIWPRFFRPVFYSEKPIKPVTFYCVFPAKADWATSWKLKNKRSWWVRNRNFCCLVILYLILFNEIKFSYRLVISLV